MNSIQNRLRYFTIIAQGVQKTTIFLTFVKALCNRMMQNGVLYIEMFFSSMSRVWLVFWIPLHLDILCACSRKPYYSVNTHVMYVIQLLNTVTSNFTINADYLWFKTNSAGVLYRFTSWFGIVFVSWRIGPSSVTEHASDSQCLGSFDDSFFAAELPTVPKVRNQAD